MPGAEADSTEGEVLVSGAKSSKLDTEDRIKGGEGGKQDIKDTGKGPAGGNCKGANIVYALYCVICKAKMNAQLQARQHYRGKYHMRRVRFFAGTLDKPVTDIVSIF